VATPDSAAVGVADRPSDTTLSERPERLVELLSLETARGTIAYWTGVLLVSFALFIPKLIPCVDYPQHLALADIARRLTDPTAPEQVTHQINYFTYNGLFHILVAKLGRLMPIELAGRVVVSFSLILLGGAVLALVRVLRRPPAYAALATPALFSFAVGWGFVNYALGTALAFTTAALVARTLTRPTLASVVATAIVGWLCALTHVLAMLLLCLFAASLAPEVSFRAVSARTKLGRLGKATLRSFIALAPLLIGCVWCIAVYREQYEWDPVMYKDRTLEGTSPPIWQKIAYFGSFATGLHSDFTDQGVLGLAFLVCAIAIVYGIRQRNRGDSVLVLPFIAAFAAYLATPMVFIGTHLIFPRLTQAVVIGAILAMPALTGQAAPRLRVAALTIGVVTGVNIVGHMVVYAAETNDASRVMDDMPEGRRVAGVIYGGDTFSFRHGTLVHAAAYYAARKHGDWAFSFARFLSVPVRFRPGGGPPWPLKGWEFNASDYNPRCKYARHFDLVLIKAPKLVTEEQELRTIVFGRDASAVKFVSHHGRFWAFDTKGLPTDGTW